MYIIVEFGDHDFGYKIQAGLKSVYEDCRADRCPTTIKGLIVGHVVGESLKQYAMSPNGYPYDTAMDYASSIYGYIDNGLRVTVDYHKPDDERMFGDASYGLDTNTGYCWYLG